MIQHAMFMHTQIPCVYTEILREVERHAAQGSGVRRRRPYLIRKSIKLLAALEPLLARLPAAMSTDATSAPHVAAIILGNSLASPRLVYLLRLDGCGDGGDTVPGVRRLMRALAMQAGDITTVNPGLCRLHLLLRAHRDAGLGSHGFRARPGLVLRLKRAHVATVRTTRAPDSSGGGGGDGASDDDDPQEALAAGRTPAWLLGLVSRDCRHNVAGRCGDAAVCEVSVTRADQPRARLPLCWQVGGFVPPPPPPRRVPAASAAPSHAKTVEVGVAAMVPPIAETVPDYTEMLPAAAALPTSTAGEAIWWQAACGVIKGFRLPGTSSVE